MPSQGAIERDTPLLLDRRRRAAEACLYLPEAACGVVVLAPSPDCGPGGQSELIGAMLAKDLGVLVPAALPESEPEDGPRADRELAALLLRSLNWLQQHPPTLSLPLGLLGLGKGAMAALYAGSLHPNPARAVVAALAGVELRNLGLRSLDIPALFIADLADPFDRRYSHHAADVLGPLGWSRDVNDLPALASEAAAWLRLQLAPCRGGACGCDPA